MYIDICCLATSLNISKYFSPNNQNTADPAYELGNKPLPKDVQLDKNPAYSAADTGDSSEDHLYDFIADSDPAKIKTQI